MVNVPSGQTFFVGKNWCKSEKNGDSRKILETVGKKWRQSEKSDCLLGKFLYDHPGFRLAGAAEVPSGASLVGSHLLYHWQEAGWVRGMVLRSSRVAGFSHVVRYGAQSALGSVVVDSLLDVASHGPPGRWTLLCRLR